MKHQFHETIILSLELKSVKKGKIELTVSHQMERTEEKKTWSKEDVATE